MRERGLLVTIKEDTQSNVIDSHTPGGANTITWKRQKDELFQYKSQTIWKIDNLFFLFSFWKYQTLLRTKKWRNEKKTILPLMKRNDLAPTKWCWKPNLVQWFHSFENGILRIWLFRPLIYYLIKCRKTTNDNLSTSFKQRIFHFALIHLCSTCKQKLYLIQILRSIYAVKPSFMEKDRCSEWFSKETNKNEATKITIDSRNSDDDNIHTVVYTITKIWIARNFLL